MWNMERKVALIKELNELSHSGVAGDPQLKSAYDDVVGKLNVYRFEPLEIGGVDWALPTLAKAMSGASFWIGVLIYALVTSRGSERDAGDILVYGFIVLIAVIYGVIATVTPNLGSPWINVVLNLALYGGIGGWIIIGGLRERLREARAYTARKEEEEGAIPAITSKAGVRRRRVRGWIRTKLRRRP